MMTELTISDPGIAAILPPRYLAIWQDIPRDLLTQSEMQLRESIKRSLKPVEYARFTEFRIAFWEAVDAKQKNDLGLPRSPVDFKNLERGYFASGFLEDKFFEQPELFVWLLFPLSQFLLQLKGFESLADERILEILSTPSVTPGGVCNPKLAGIHVKIYELLQNRIHGAVVQKSEVNQKNLNVNVGAGQPAPGQQISQLTDLSEIDRRIKEIEKKRLALKEVTPIQVDTAQIMLPEK